MRLRTILVFLLIGNLFFITIDTSYSQIRIGEDERISVTVNEFQRVSSAKYYSHFAEDTLNLVAYTFGRDLAIIDITLEEKKKLFINHRMERDLAKTRLIDEYRRAHRARFGYFFRIVDGQITEVFQIDHFESGTKRFVQPSGKDTDSLRLETGFLVFEVPKNSSPIQFIYQYQYREDNSRKSKLTNGEIVINLLQIQ